MVDLICLLAKAKNKIIVLGALESDTEAGNFLQQAPAVNSEVAGVHDSQHMLRRPVRLEVWAHPTSFWVQHIFVAIDHIGVVLLLQETHNLVQGVGAYARHRDRASRRTPRKQVRGHGWMPG